MAVTDSTQSIPSVAPWDPQQGDLGRDHVLYNTQTRDITPQELVAAGWTSCPRCHGSWISPETKREVENQGGYYTCPKCKLTTDLMDNLPWHGVIEPEYYPGQGAGGGTHVGLPMTDVGQIAENIVRQMGEIPGYGPITWWHGSAHEASPLDGATPEWGIEVKGVCYDAAGHFWDPRNGQNPEYSESKNQAAREMNLRGVLGILVIENFRDDRADVYAKAMPLEPWKNGQGRMMPGGVAKWHKRTGEKIASNVPFENPYKDPDHPSPGPYSLADYYQPPAPLENAQAPAPEGMPF